MTKGIVKNFDKIIRLEHIDRFSIIGDSGCEGLGKFNYNAKMFIFNHL